MAGMMGFNPYGGYGQPQGYMPQAAQMAAQQAYAQQMQSQMMPQAPAQPGVTVRLVTSRDEATTAQIPFDATINVFVNMSAGEIYIKRFNPQTGGAWFADYVPKTPAEAKPAEEDAPEYVTVDRFGALEARVSELAESIAMRRRSVKTDE